MSNQPNILIVDDDPMNRTIMEEILDEHYSLIWAEDGLQAVEAFKRHRPALVLMDIMMPNLNGYEACKQIKQLPDTELNQVILVSAKATSEERVKGYEHGADDYIIKPFDESELLAKVRVYFRLYNALIQLKQAQEQLSAHNQQLHQEVDQTKQQLKDSRDLVVFALAQLADSRDPETGEHLERMRQYCLIIAKSLKKDSLYQDLIDDTFIDQIYQASPLHDIGKVGIPDTILLKPGRLTDHEFEMMKEHTVIGADALLHVLSQGEAAGFLTMAHEIARSHHERWDGKGYPDKISQEQIPLSARICAVADVFDALTSVRVYKRAFTIETAKQMICDDRGTHFDPIVTDAFSACFDEIKQIATQKQIKSHNLAA